VQAADIALSVRLRELCDAVKEPDSNSTLIERQRIVSAQCSKILALVKQGNAKPASYPNKLGLETRLPELRQFREIGFALVTKAQVDFADGRVNQGFETLLDVLVFSDRISFCGPMVFNLTGRVMSGTAVRTLFEHLPMASLPTAWDIQRTAGSLSADTNPWAVSLESELKVMVPEVLDRLKDPQMIADISEDESIGVDLKALSAEQMESVRKELGFCLPQYYTELLKVTDLPESQWVGASNKIRDRTSPQNQFALRIFDTVVPNTSRAIVQELVRRTHLRLLRVVGAVVEYRWTNGYYPGALTQLRDPSIAHDPLTGGEFAYQRVPGSFTVFSEGTEDTGKIGLDWTAPSR
jgi:hypothetical protein